MSPATPDGFCSSVKMRMTPPNSWNQLPLSPNQTSSACGISPPAETRPAKIAPEMSVMPPAYANAISESAMITSYWFSLTEPKSNAYSTPATPAMNAAMVNAYSLTVRGLTAAAAAARSLDRTASIRCPSLPRLMKPTITHSSTQQASATQPNTGDGTLPSMPRNPALVPGAGPKQLELGPPRAGRAAAPGGVGEAEVLDRDRARQRHHRQRHPAHPHRRERRDHPDPHRDGDADQRVEPE